MASSRIPDPSETPFVGVEDAAKILDISLGTAYAAINNGSLPHIRVGRLIRIPTRVLLDLAGA